MIDYLPRIKFNLAKIFNLINQASDAQLLIDEAMQTTDDLSEDKNSNLLIPLNVHARLAAPVFSTED